MPLLFAVHALALQENVPVVQSIQVSREMQYRGLQLFFAGFGVPLQRTLQEIETRFPEAKIMSIQKIAAEAFRNFEFENHLYQSSPYLSEATKKKLRLRQQRLEIAEDFFRAQWSANMSPAQVRTLLTELKKIHPWIQIPDLEGEGLQ